MASDLFDQLAASDVPPPPEQFDRQVHQRLNRALVAMHLLDLVARAVPWGLVHLARAAAAALRFTLTGRYPAAGRHPPARRRPPGGS